MYIWGDIEIINATILSSLTTLLCSLLYEEKKRSKEQRSVVSVPGRPLGPAPQRHPELREAFGRSLGGGQATRNTTVQLLTELDGVGADIARVCEQATEAALAESTRTGRVRTITMRDLQRALGRARPNCGAWFSRARNVVTYANNDGEYDDLRRYMAARKLL